MEKNEIYEVLNAAYFSENPHELETLQHLEEIVSPKSRFVDIGASLGQYTKHVASLLQSGAILAIEADPIRHEELARNIGLWQVEAKDVELTCRHAAVCGVPGPISFESTNSNVSGGITRSELSHLDDQAKHNISWEQVTVPGVTLDEIYEEFCPSVIKMDIEGAELDALNGASKMLSEGDVSILVEFHGWGGPDNGPTGNAFTEKMRSFGYDFIPFFDKYFFCKALPKRFPRLYRRHRIASTFAGLKRRLRKMLGQ